MARRIEVEIVGDSRSLERAFDRSARSAKQFDRQMSTTSTSLSKSFKGGAAAVGISVGLSTLVTGMRDAVKASSNLSEQLSKNKAVFDGAAPSVEAWAKSMNTLGLSTRAAVEATSGLGALFKPLGIVGDEAAQQSMKLTQLGVDLASFYDTDVQSALDAVRSGLVGESEPLRRYGVLLSEAKVQAQAMADSGKTSASALTDQEKVLARVNIIMRESTVAQGDAARSADRYAGQTKTLNANIENLQASVGNLLIPALTGATGAMNDWLPVLTGIVDQLERWSKLKFPNLPLGGGGGSVGDAAGKSFLTLVPGVGPLLALGKMFGVGGGGGAKPPGGTGMGGVGSIFDSIQNALGGAGDAVKAASAIRTANSTLDDLVGFINKWANAGKKFEAAQKAAAAHRARMELQRQRFAAGLENQWGWLEFGLERAQATDRTADDRRALRKQEAWLKNRIAHEGRTLNRVRELWRVRQQIRDLNKKQSDVDPLAGLMQVSTRRLTDILAAGTGLGVAGRQQLGRNIAGAEIQHIHVHIDGREVGVAVARQQARTDRRTSRQTSGYRG